PERGQHFLKQLNIMDIQRSNACVVAGNRTGWDRIQGKSVVAIVLLENIGQVLLRHISTHSPDPPGYLDRALIGNLHGTAGFDHGAIAPAIERVRFGDAEIDLFADEAIRFSVISGRRLKLWRMADREPIGSIAVSKPRLGGG